MTGAVGEREGRHPGGPKGVPATFQMAQPTTLADAWLALIRIAAWPQGDLAPVPAERVRVGPVEVVEHRERRQRRTIASVSVALLLPVSGSTVTPLVATVAVLARFPDGAFAATVTVAVNVALSPFSRVTVPVRALPDPVAAQLEAGDRHAGPRVDGSDGREACR